MPRKEVEITPRRLLGLGRCASMGGFLGGTTENVSVFYELYMFLFVFFRQ